MSSEARDTEGPTPAAEGVDSDAAAGGSTRGVAAAMEEYDWSAGPLGPPAAWPTELGTMLRALEASRFSMWLGWGPDLLFFYNDAYRRDTLGVKHPWALGRPAREVWAEAWEDLAPRISRVMDHGEATWDEGLFLVLERRGFPEETYHTFSYSPITSQHGAVLGLLCVVTEDTDRIIGERRMATLRRLSADLSEQRTEQHVLSAVAARLSENQSDLPFTGVYLRDDKGVARLGCATGIEGGEPAAPELVEAGAGSWPLDEVDDTPVARLVPDLPSRFSQLPAGAWDRPPKDGVIVPLRRRAGRAAMGYLVAGLNPLRPADEEYLGFVEVLAGQVAAGLASARAFESERRRAEALAELDRAKTMFFSNVSHEFRTPLTLMLGPLENAIEGEADPAVRDELLVVRRNGARLARLVNSLLDFSRIEAGRTDASFRPTDLAEATESLASVFRSAFEAAGLELIVDLAPPDVPVYVDREMWEKVVLNLLSNALKHTFVGGVTVAYGPEDGRAVLRVTDTGTGIAAGELPRLFERFHRVEGARARTHEGTGIGLALVRELVLLHGGEIEAESEPGQGTTMTVRIPFGTAHLPADRILEEALSEAQSPEAQPFVDEALRWLPGAVLDNALPEPARDGRVLVVDDNADMRDYIARLLAPHYRVETAADAEEALRVVARDPPELVLSDVMMPGIGGLELVRRLRRESRSAGIPVVLLSARAGEESATEGLDLGADDYLAKPFSARELISRVSAHLELGRGRREGEERFRDFADKAPALIWLMNADGQRTFVNRAWLTFTGRTPSEELGRGWMESVHDDDRERVREVLEASVARGEPMEVEYRLRRFDGRYRWVLDRAAAVVADGQSTAWAGGCLDVDERYREREQQSLLARIGATLDRDLTVHERLSSLGRLLVDSGHAEACAVDLRGERGAAEADSFVIQRSGSRAWRPGAKIRSAQAEVARSGTTQARSSWIVVPLMARGGILGALSMTRPPSRPFEGADAELAEEIGRRAGLAIDNARLFEDEVQASRRVAAISEAIADLAAAATTAQVADAVIRQASRLAGSDTAALYEIVEDRLRVVAPGSWPLLAAEWPDVPLDYPSPGTESAREGRTVVVESVEECERRYPPEVAAAMSAMDLGSAVSVPLLIAGRCTGIVATGWHGERRLMPKEQRALEALAEQCAMALERVRLHERQREIAAILQRSLLPADLPQLARVSVAARYAPGAEGTEAGGDWYDVIPLGDEALMLTVGDVVGRGPSAAAAMGQLRSALGAFVSEGHGPAAALERLDRFARRVSGATASTAMCIRIDAAREELTWACAGHPAPILARAGAARMLPQPGGTLLGTVASQDFREMRERLHAGDCLVAFSDGLFERRTESIDVGLARLISYAAAEAARPTDEIAEHVFERALAGRDTADDAVLVAARLHPAPLVVRRPAQAAELAGIRRELRRWLGAGGVSGARSDDLVLAVGEALANCAEHAYAPDAPGDMEARLARDAEGRIQIAVSDEGVWAESSSAPNRGRGILIMRGLVDDLTITNGSMGTVVEMVHPLRTHERGEVDAEPGPDRPSSPEMTAEPAAGGLRLRIAEEIDMSSAPELRERLAAAIDGRRPVILDLTRTGHFGSAGVAAIMEAAARADGTQARLTVVVRSGSTPARVLSLAGLGAPLLVVEDPETQEATRAVDGQDMPRP